MLSRSFAIKVGILFAVLLTVSAGSFAQKVRYNYLPGTDFTRFKTYKWAKIENGNYPNQILDEQLMRSIDAQLTKKGLTKVDEGIPDLAVVYQVAVDHDKEWNAYGTGGSYWGWGGWGGWGGMGGTTVYSRTISIGTLNLDMYEVLTKKQVWRGEATKTLDRPKDPAKLQKNIDKAMAKLLKNFPPTK